MDKLLFDTVWAYYDGDGELEKVLLREDWYDRLDYLWKGGDHGAETFTDLADESSDGRWTDLELGVDTNARNIVFMVMMVKAAAKHGLSIGRWRRELQTIYDGDDGTPESKIHVVPRPVEIPG